MHSALAVEPLPKFHHGITYDAQLFASPWNCLKQQVNEVSWITKEDPVSTRCSCREQDSQSLTCSSSPAPCSAVPAALLFKLRKTRASFYKNNSILGKQHWHFIFWFRSLLLYFPSYDFNFWLHPVIQCSM